MKSIVFHIDITQQLVLTPVPLPPKELKLVIM